MTRNLITVEDLMNRYPISNENMLHLIRTEKLMPIKFGNQTFFDFDYVDLMVSNAIMAAEMHAGMHRPLKATHQK